MSDIATPGANALLGGTAHPTTVYVQAHTGNPGTNGTANVSSDTRRLTCTLGTPSGGAVSNTNEAELSNWAATETITHFSIWDAASGGVCWWVDDAVDVAIEAGQKLVIAVGDLDLALTVWS